jgi:hypothetical protein
VQSQQLFLSFSPPLVPFPSLPSSLPPHSPSCFKAISSDARPSGNPFFQASCYSG